MLPDPLHINSVTGTNVLIGHGAHQTIILDGQPVALPNFDDLLAHLRAVAAYPSFRRWADRPETDPPLSQQPSLDVGPPRVWPDHYVDERAAPAAAGDVLPQRLVAWRQDPSSPSPPDRDLLEALADAKRAVILGEPGSGKTTALERLAWVMATRSLAAVEGGLLDLPMFVPLRDYRGEADLMPSLRRALHHHGVLELNDLSLRLLLRARNLRFTLLLDGLNELGHYAEEGAVAIACHLRDYPHHTVYLTCRTADFDCIGQQHLELRENRRTGTRPSKGQRNQHLAGSESSPYAVTKA